MVNLTAAAEHELGVLKHVSFVLETLAGGAMREGKREKGAGLAAEERRACDDGPTACAGTLTDLASASAYLWRLVISGWASLQNGDAAHRRERWYARRLGAHVGAPGRLRRGCEAWHPRRRCRARSPARAPKPELAAADLVEVRISPPLTALVLHGELGPERPSARPIRTIAGLERPCILRKVSDAIPVLASGGGPES
jgi:hypothetical protein